MSLREDRIEFTRLVVEIIIWINDIYSINNPHINGKVEVAIDEWTVKNPRLVKIDGENRIAIDKVHNPRGQHPNGLAVDLLIYINDEYVSDGNHPIWKIIDDRCRSIRSDFGLGIRFHDSNHLSLGE